MKRSKGLLYGRTTDGSVYVAGLGNCTDSNIVIPPICKGKSVTGIGDFAFSDCTGLTNITIPYSVTDVGWGAFYRCADLSSVSHNYKAFRINKAGNLQCRNKRFRMGKKNYCKGPLELCRNGIHYCTNIFDIFYYYYGEYGKDFVIGICDVSNENVGGNDDSKRCARWVIPNRILTKEEVINIMNEGDIS